MQYEYKDRRNNVKNPRFSKLVFRHKLWPFFLNQYESYRFRIPVTLKS